MHPDRIPKIILWVKKKFMKIYKAMERLWFIICVIALSRPSSGKDNDDKWYVPEFINSKRLNEENRYQLYQRK
jgi:hypothetical protein